MGRPKQFNREGVLDRAIPVFWKHGFANTTVRHLEEATGVNKSGLYSEFKDKEDLFLASLERYAQTRGAEILTAEPIGWGNIESIDLMDREGTTRAFSSLDKVTD